MGAILNQEMRDEEWHELFDTLAIRLGHHDNLELARAYCAVTGTNSQSAFDTAVKNLRNWRIGLHVPQRRNFLIISEIIGIEHRSLELRERWIETYTTARGNNGAKPSNVGNPADFILTDLTEKVSGQDLHGDSQPELATGKQPASAPSELTFGIKGASVLKLLAAGVIGLCVGTIVTTVLTGMVASQPGALPGNFAGAADDLRRVVLLKPGESMVIGGVTDRSCGDEPPSWELVAEDLPPLAIGTFTDGGAGTHYDSHCGQRTAARGVMLTATDLGLEQFTLDDEHLIVHVYR